MVAVSPFRLTLLRIGYVLFAILLGSTVWPDILDPQQSWTLMSGVVKSMLAALSALAILGLRYPLQMLPLLLFEVGWKMIWLLRVALPNWAAGTLDAGTTQVALECIGVIVFFFLIPWGYVAHAYLAKPGEPWRKAADA